MSSFLNPSCKDIFQVYSYAFLSFHIFYNLLFSMCFVKNCLASYLFLSRNPLWANQFLAKFLPLYVLALFSIFIYGSDLLVCLWIFSPSPSRSFNFCINNFQWFVFPSCQVFVSKFLFCFNSLLTPKHFALNNASIPRLLLLTWPRKPSFHVWGLIRNFI